MSIGETVLSRDPQQVFEGSPNQCNHDGEHGDPSDLITAWAKAEGRRQRSRTPAISVQMQTVHTMVAVFMAFLYICGGRGGGGAGATALFGASGGGGGGPPGPRLAEGTPGPEGPKGGGGGGASAVGGWPATIVWPFAVTLCASKLVCPAITRCVPLT